MTKILFAYDGSDESRRALRYASRLSERDNVIVLSVATKLIEAPSTTQFTLSLIHISEPTRPY